MAVCCVCAYHPRLEDWCSQVEKMEKDLQKADQRRNEQLQQAVAKIEKICSQTMRTVNKESARTTQLLQRIESLSQQSKQQAAVLAQFEQRLRGCEQAYELLTMREAPPMETGIPSTTAPEPQKKKKAPKKVEAAKPQQKKEKPSDDFLLEEFIKQHPAKPDEPKPVTEKKWVEGIGTRLSQNELDLVDVLHNPKSKISLVEYDVRTHAPTGKSSAEMRRELLTYFTNRQKSPSVPEILAKSGRYLVQVNRRTGTAVSLVPATAVPK